MEAAESDVLLANKLSPQFQVEGAELLEKLGAGLDKIRDQRKTYEGFLNKKGKEGNVKEGLHKGVAQKAVKGLNGKLYEDVDKAMEPAREKERERHMQLELEKDLLGVLDESKGKKPPDTFEKFMVERGQRFEEQEDQLDQKKKVLSKLEREKKWSEDEAWEETKVKLKGQRECRTSHGWTEKNMSRWAKMRLRETTVGVALEANEDFDPKRASQVTSEQLACSDNMCLKALVCDCEFGQERDEAAIIYRPGQKALHFWDFQLTLDWEVVVCKRGDRSYRSASELIKVAADGGGTMCPPNVTENCVLRGSFDFDTFASDEVGELDEDLYKPVSRILKRGGFGTKVERLAEELQEKLHARIEKRLLAWIAEFREQS